MQDARLADPGLVLVVDDHEDVRAFLEAALAALRPAGRTFGPRRGVVLDAVGRIRHRFKLNGSLLGPLVASEDNGSLSVNRRMRVSRIDPRTGRTVKHRILRVDGNWLLPGTPGAPMLSTYRGYAAIDPQTLRLRGPEFGAGRRILPAGKGWVALDEDGVLTGHRASGRRTWRTRTDIRVASVLGVIGRFLYVQRGLDTREQPNYRVEVFNVRTGRRAGVVPGRFTLTNPHRGRTFGQVPTLSGGELLFDDN